MKILFFSFILFCCAAVCADSNGALAKPLLKRTLILEDTLYTGKFLRARLGKTLFYVQKPEDCIENVFSENSNQSGMYIFEARNKKANTTNGRCTFVIDRTYYSRLKTYNQVTTFRDSIFGQGVTVKQYSTAIELQNSQKVTETTREIEMNVNGLFIWICCSGTIPAELAKFYAIGKSLSN